MIKLLCVDLDGTLVNLKQAHYLALNKALNTISPTYEISPAEHLTTFDGLPTSVKLKLLSKLKGLPDATYGQIITDKQKYTIELINHTVKPNEPIIETCRKLKEEGYLLSCCSNSVRETVKTVLDKMQLLKYFDSYFSNQEVSNSKPHPEIFHKSLAYHKVLPTETLILEDSKVGRECAQLSGCHLLTIDDPDCVTYERIKEKIKKIDKEEKWVGWVDDNLNIVIPCAGLGLRYKQAGYNLPKPLINVLNKPMIQGVIESLNIKANYIYLVQKEHLENYQFEYILNLLTPNCTIIPVDGLTDGATRTVLLAKEHINNNKKLIIANSDQWFNFDSADFMYKMIYQDLDGGILTFRNDHPKWSYAKVNEQGFVTEVAEKKVISNLSTVGAYYFKTGKLFVNAAEQMIKKDIRTNGEIYNCPVYNEIIENGGKVVTYDVKSMTALGTPEDLQYFVENYK